MKWSPIFSSTKIFLRLYPHSCLSSLVIPVLSFQNASNDWEVSSNGARIQHSRTSDSITSSGLTLSLPGRRSPSFPNPRNNLYTYLVEICGVNLSEAAGFSTSVSMESTLASVEDRIRNSGPTCRNHPTGVTFACTLGLGRTALSSRGL